MDIFDKLSMAGIVPVIKIEDAADAVPLCEALKRGGLPVAEITFRTDAAEQAIKNVHEALPDVMLGAGTVLTVEQVKRAVAAGATYIVSPGLNPKVVAYCVENGIAVLPGCSNPSDIEIALEMGLKTVKFFPAEAAGGIKMIKAMSAPYGAINFVPTGGINEKNAAEYLAFSKVRAVGGSWMVPSDAVKAKDWARIEQLTRAAVDAMLGFGLVHVGLNFNGKDDAVSAAEGFNALLGWPVAVGNSSTFCGKEFEFMHKNGRGTHGHIAIATNSLKRAMWHLEMRGYRFIPETVNDQIAYLEGEIGGFAVHLKQK